MAVAEAAITQVGTWRCSALSDPCATSASVITPIVFWLSFVPWEIASSALESTWPSRKRRT